MKKFLASVLVAVSLVVGSSFMVSNPVEAGQYAEWVWDESSVYVIENSDNRFKFNISVKKINLNNNEPFTIQYDWYNGSGVVHYKYSFKNKWYSFDVTNLVPDHLGNYYIFSKTFYQKRGYSFT